ncbi:amidohydrolase family protein [Gordonia sp. NPDC003424]
MPVRVVDAHMRFWELANGWYPAIVDYVDSVHTPELLNDFGWDDYLLAAGDFPVERFVHVSSTGGRAYLDELRWITGIAEQNRLDVRYIGSVDPRMSAAEIVADLDAQCAMNPHVAGMRVVYDFTPDSAAARTVLTWLNEHHLTFDLMTQPEEMDGWLRALEPFPDLTVALQHNGFPTATDDDGYAVWLAAIQACARHTDAYCTISGLGMTTNTFETTVLRRWIEPTIDAFGWDRVMFGSNFPVHRIGGTYRQLQQALDAIIGEARADDLDRFYAANAIEVYGFEN